jgi:hypothetical protein
MLSSSLQLCQALSFIPRVFANECSSYGGFWAEEISAAQKLVQILRIDAVGEEKKTKVKIKDNKSNEEKEMVNEFVNDGPYPLSDSEYSMLEQMLSDPGYLNAIAEKSQTQ